MYQFVLESRSKTKDGIVEALREIAMLIEQTGIDKWANAIYGSADEDKNTLSESNWALEEIAKGCTNDKIRG